MGTFLNYPIKDFINQNNNKNIKEEMNNEIIDKTDVNTFKNSNKDKEGLIDLSINNSVEKYFNKNFISINDKQPLFKKNIALETNSKDKKEMIDLSKNLNHDLCSTKVATIQKKNSQVNLLNLMNNIFFKNEQQTEINIHIC